MRKGARINMEIYNYDQQYCNYKEILERSRAKLLQGGTADPYLLEPDMDTRMSVSLIIRPPELISSNIISLTDKLRSEEPDMYYYPQSDMHITVMDILSGAPGRQVPDNISDYALCISECTLNVRPFQIDFVGLTASDGALLVCGYYERGLETLRELLRSSLAAKNLALEERYKTSSAHITVARFIKKIGSPERFLRFCNYGPQFGTMRVSSVELVYHNWYDSKKTTLARFGLGGYTV